jgi:2-polyprenyl-3-methyl-5-hydroxy-6-metoxy-1,4-benzoquinol methylase
MKEDYLIAECPNGCGDTLRETNISVSEGVIRECSLCGQMVSSCTQEYYEKSNQKWNIEEGTWPSENDYKRLFRRRKRDIDFISKNLNKPLSNIHILDVGCSSGSSVFIAKELGLNAEGVDTSDKAVLKGKERGLNIHSGFLHDVSFASDSFDAITLYEVIEHVETPIHLLKECHRILRPGGILVVGTGNTDSWTKKIRKDKWEFFNMNYFGGHINFFSTGSINILASQTGFTVVKNRTASVTFIDKNEAPWVLYRLSKIFSELCYLPSKIFNKGHQMEVYLVADR